MQLPTYVSKFDELYNNNNIRDVIIGKKTLWLNFKSYDDISLHQSYPEETDILFYFTFRKHETHYHVYTGCCQSVKGFQTLHVEKGNINIEELIKRVILPNWRTLCNMYEGTKRFYVRYYEYYDIHDDYRDCLFDFVVDNIFALLIVNPGSLKERLMRLENEYHKTPRKTKKRIIKKLIDHEYIEKKAQFIQRSWRRCITNPEYLICKQRLLAEFNGLDHI